MSVSAKPAKPRSSAAPPSPLGWAFSSSVCWIWPTLSRSGITAMPMADSVTEIGYGAFEDCDSLKTVIVGRDSYALTYCRENGLPYTYPDANDWLNG